MTALGPGLRRVDDRSGMWGIGHAAPCVVGSRIDRRRSTFRPRPVGRRPGAERVSSGFQRLRTASDLRRPRRLAPVRPRRRLQQLHLGRGHLRGQGKRGPRDAGRGAQPHDAQRPEELGASRLPHPRSPGSDVPKRTSAKRSPQPTSSASRSASTTPRWQDAKRLAAFSKEYETTLDRILAQIDTLRAGKPTIVRLTEIYNNGIGEKPATRPGRTGDRRRRLEARDRGAEQGDLLGRQGTWRRLRRHLSPVQRTGRTVEPGRSRLPRARRECIRASSGRTSSLRPWRRRATPRCAEEQRRLRKVGSRRPHAGSGVELRPSTDTYPLPVRSPP